MDYDQTMRSRVEAMPRWRFVCERDWIVGPSDYAVGFLWDRKLDAQPGEFVYRRRLLLRFAFKMQLERR